MGVKTDSHLKSDCQFDFLEQVFQFRKRRIGFEGLVTAILLIQVLPALGA